MYGCVVPDKETLRQNVSDAFERFMTRGEAGLAERLYHPDYFNHEADPERSSGIEGAKATADWLRSCFGEVSYEVERIIVEDDMGAAYGPRRGRPGGALPPNVRATHKPFAVKHVHLIR